jgi:hypothetical protein
LVAADLFSARIGHWDGLVGWSDARRRACSNHDMGSPYDHDMGSPYDHDMGSPYDHDMGSPYDHNADEDLRGCWKQQ